MNKKALIFLILTILSFFVSLFLNFHKINIPYLGGLYKEVQVDIIFKHNSPKIFYENEEIKNYLKIDENHYLYKSNELNLIQKIKFENIENIKKAMIFNGNETIFINNIQEEIKLNNNKNLFDKACIALLSYFYNPQFYLLSYVFLFLFLSNFQFNYKKTKITALSILFLSFLLRMAQLNNIPFWDDEIYILTHTNKWLEAFQDPGNPPLYFILFKLYRSIFQNSDFYRFFAVIIGCLFNICFYFYIKMFLGKKPAIIGLFLISINIILIYFSQEIRCYMLLMLLAILNSYFLFKFNNKNKFKYLISVVALLYTHFYGAFFVLYNFVFGLSIFKNKKLKSFISLNIVSFLCYLPLLIYKKASITSVFNTWLKIPTLDTYNSLTETLFGSFCGFVLFSIILVVLHFHCSKNQRLYIKYNYFAIIFVFLCAIVVTYLIKPIFFAKYFYIVFPNVLALIVLIYSFFAKRKIGLVLIFFLFFLFNFKISYQNLFCNHNLYIDFICNDIDKTKTNYVFLTDTVSGYKKFELKDTKLKYLPVNYGIDVLNIEKYDIKKPSVVYALNLYLDFKTLSIAKNIELYKTPLGVFCKIEL